ncbi:MAG: phosphoglucosamine mutase [Candidatus Thermoplasmatota archaeon]|nr:phosphoglucosamine mutase [Candidatus Thermoplasmatota archaeon]
MNNIFRAYDIRGIYNEELDPIIVARIGMAFGTYLGGTGKVSLGRDGRTSSIAMEQALISGIVSTGVHVVSLGLLPIPTANYWTWKNDFTAGVYITASHNPAQYNGIRFRHPDGTGYTGGNNEIRDIYLGDRFKKADWDSLGHVSHEDSNVVIEDYLDFISRHCSYKKKLTVVIDPGNGVGTLTAPRIFKRLGMNVITINSQVDGTFPGRPSEPSAENLVDLCDMVVKSGADLGIGYDGDADRCVFVDEGGRVVQVEKVAVMLGRMIIKEHEGPVITTVSGSMIVKEEIERSGGEVITIRVGDVFVAEAIKEYKAAFAAEDSAHFFIPFDYSFDDPLLTSMILLELISNGTSTLGDLAHEIPSYPKTEKAHDCDDGIKFDVIEDVVKHYKALEHLNLEVSTIDGARITYPDGWGLIRCSNTQPKVRITVEAHSVDRLNELEREFTNVFNEMKKGRTAGDLS